MAADSGADRGHKAEEIASWFTPMQALAYASIIVGAKGASNAVWQLLVAGMIQTASTTSSMTPQGRGPTTQREPSYIPGRVWKHFTQHGSDLWEGGYAKFDLGNTVHQHFGIKLNPEDVRANLPPLPVQTLTIEHAPTSPAEIKEVAPVAKKGGRPRKDFWDDLWIEVCAHIHEMGIPEQQADIENMMLDWAAKNGHDLSLSSVRPRARKLLQRLRNPRTKT